MRQMSQRNCECAFSATGSRAQILRYSNGTAGFGRLDLVCVQRELVAAQPISVPKKLLIPLAFLNHTIEMMRVSCVSVAQLLPKFRRTVHIDILLSARHLLSILSFCVRSCSEQYGADRTNASKHPFISRFYLFISFAIFEEPHLLAHCLCHQNLCKTTHTKIIHISARAWNFNAKYTRDVHKQTGTFNGE